MDGFEQREMLGDAYWKDKRWKEVNALRKQADKLPPDAKKAIELNTKANGLVNAIHNSWGND